MHTNRLDLIAAGERYKHLQQAYDREFEARPDGAIVAIRSPNPERATAFATALAQRWQTDPNIAQVVYRVNVDALKHKAFWYLSPEDLIALRQKLERHQDLLTELGALPTLEHLFALVNQEMTQALVGHVFTGGLEEDGHEKTPPRPQPAAGALAADEPMAGRPPCLPVPLGGVVHEGRRSLGE